MINHTPMQPHRINRSDSPRGARGEIAALLRLCCLTVLSVQLVLSTAACTVDTKGSGGGRAPSELTVGEAANGKSFRMRRGGTITIRIPGNPTTGYTWAVDKVDENILELTDSVFSRTSDARIGSGGWRTLTFKAISPGTTPVQLKYWRAWEGESSVVRRFSITVRVDN